MPEPIALAEASWARQIFADSAVAGCLYAIVGTGFGLIYNTTRVFHVAYGATYVVGAYIAYALSAVIGWPLVPAALAAVALTALLGGAMEHAVYAPITRRGSSQEVLLLTSLGLYTVLVNLVVVTAGNGSRTFGYGTPDVYRFAGVILTELQVLQVLLATIIVPGVFVFLHRTDLGSAIRAVRDDPVLASVMGIDQGRIRFLVFALGSAACALAAILTAADVGINPHAGMSLLLSATVAVVIGGVGVFHGGALGGLVLGLIRGIVVWHVSARWADAVTFAVLGIVLILRPQGLLGVRRRIEEHVP